MLFCIFLVSIAEAATLTQFQVRDVGSPDLLKAFDVTGSHMTVILFNQTYINFYYINLLNLQMLSYGRSLTGMNASSMMEIRTWAANNETHGKYLLSATALNFFFAGNLQIPGFNTSQTLLPITTQAFVPDENIAYIISYSVLNGTIIDVLSAGTLHTNLLNLADMKIYLARVSGDYLFLYGDQTTSDQQLVIIYRPDMTVSQRILFAYDSSTIMELCNNNIVILNNLSVFEVLTVPPFTITEIFRVAMQGYSLACIASDRIIIQLDTGAGDTFIFDYMGNIIEQMPDPILKAHFAVFDNPLGPSFAMITDSNVLRTYVINQPVVPPINPTTSSNNETETNIQTFLPKQTSEATGNALVVLSMKNTFNFGSPLTLLLDQFWLYKFHYGVNYPVWLQRCTEQTNIINFSKQRPKFFRNISIPDSIHNNYKYQRLFNMSRSTGKGLDISNIFFIQATKDIFVLGMPINIALFAFITICRKILSALHRKNQNNSAIKSFYTKFCYQSRMWVLLTMLMQTNYMQLCFSGFNQLSLPVFFNFFTKINIALAITVLFICMSYSLYSYIVFSKYNKNSSKNIITFSKISRKSFWLENIMCNLARFLRACCHSNIFFAHMLKLKMLIGVDCALIIVMAVLRKQFNNKLTFFVYLIYGVMFAILNSLLFASLRYQFISQSLNRSREEITKILILCLFAMTAIKIMLNVFHNCQESCCQSKNKVEPKTEDSLEGNRIPNIFANRLKTEKNYERPKLSAYDLEKEQQPRIQESVQSDSQPKKQRTSKRRKKVNPQRFNQTTRQISHDPLAGSKALVSSTKPKNKLKKEKEARDMALTVANIRQWRPEQSARK